MSENNKMQLPPECNVELKIGQSQVQEMLNFLSLELNRPVELRPFGEEQDKEVSEWFGKNFVNLAERITFEQTPYEFKYLRKVEFLGINLLGTGELSVNYRFHFDFMMHYPGMKNFIPSSDSLSRKELRSEILDYLLENTVFHVDQNEVNRIFVKLRKHPDLYQVDPFLKKLNEILLNRRPERFTNLQPNPMEQARLFIMARKLTYDFYHMLDLRNIMENPKVEQDYYNFINGINVAEINIPMELAVSSDTDSLALILEEVVNFLEKLHYLNRYS